MSLGIGSLSGHCAVGVQMLFLPSSCCCLTADVVENPAFLPPEFSTPGGWSGVVTNYQTD